MKKIKVLIVEDSLMFRQILVRNLITDPMLEVVAQASDPYEARDAILKYEPDVMTLDIELPRMDGIEFLRKLMPQYPLPTVVISALSDRVFDAMSAGAVEFVNKPSGMTAEQIAEFIRGELITKIKIASTVQVGKLKRVGMGIAQEPERLLQSVHQRAGRKPFMRWSGGFIRIYRERLLCSICRRDLPKCMRSG